MSELRHYGVKGMKWGIRRTPEQLGHDRILLGRKLKYTSPLRESIKSSAKAHAVSAASAFIPGLALAYNAKVIGDMASNARNNLDGKDYTKIEGPPEKLSQLKKKSTQSGIKEDMKRCNPRFIDKKGTVNNCGYCAVAMEMRRRGYDVRARKKAQGITTDDYSKWFNNVDIKRPKVERKPKESRKSFVQRSYDRLCSEIEKCGEGSRGCVGIQYEKFSSGHAMFWEVTNGQVNFYDGQNNKTNPDKLFSLADPAKHSFARLDNLKLKEQVTETVISIDKEANQA